MTIKIKISLYISLFFSFLYGLICIVVINGFSNFREVEFQSRLNQKALSTIKLLVEVKEIDKDLVKAIDRNTINELYNEKTLIFNHNFQLIYSSIDDTRINYTLSDLEYLKKNKTFFKKNGINEVYGVFYKSIENEFYALISAHDNQGKRKLNFLMLLLGASYLVFLMATWFFTFYMVQRQLKPLDQFHKNISNINDLNVYKDLEMVSNSNNEVDLLSKEFNLMMTQIAEVYHQQKEFTAHASHELRTPLLRLSAQIENRILISSEPEKQFLKAMLQDIAQVNELIYSLLLLTRHNYKSMDKQEMVRLDEIIYNAIEKVSKYFHDLSVDFNIDESLGTKENALEIHANASLLEIAFLNLIKNAYLYSPNKIVAITIFANEGGKKAVKIINKGPTLTTEEQNNLFKPFMWGKNASHTRGLGLGLLVVYRILQSSGIDISYQAQENKNIWLIIF